MKNIISIYPSGIDLESCILAKGHLGYNAEAMAN